MKKILLTLAIVLLAVAVQAQTAIKVHSTGRISLQSATTSYGIQIPSSGVMSIEPNILSSYGEIEKTIARNPLAKAWIVRLQYNPELPCESFYALGNGNVFAYSGYLTYSPPSPSKSSRQPIEGATELVSGMKGYYMDNHEFDGITPEDFENNPNVLPEALEGLLKDLEKDKVVGMYAEELEEVLPEAVRHDAEGNMAVNYSAIVPVLIEAFKEQQRTIESLQNQIAELELEDRGTFGIGEQELSSNVLYQNVPNPTNSSTSIDCYLDSRVSKAVIAVYDLNGLQLKEYPVYYQGKNTITIEANELKPGIYMYSLLVEGKLIDTKRMVITSK